MPFYRYFLLSPPTREDVMKRRRSPQQADLFSMAPEPAALHLPEPHRSQAVQWLAKLLEEAARTQNSQLPVTEVRHEQDQH
jgi:hypothetical protein